MGKPYHCRRNGELVLTTSNRPSKNNLLESIGESQLSKRFKEFTPTDFDLPMNYHELRQVKYKFKFTITPIEQ